MLNIIYGKRFADALRKERDTDVWGFLNVFVVVGAEVLLAVSVAGHIVELMKGLS